MWHAINAESIKPRDH